MAADDELSALDPDAGYAIYMASIDHMESRGTPECPKRRICMDALFDLTLDPVEYISGNPKIGRQTFRIIQHSEYRSNIILMVHVRRDTEGDWRLIGRRAVKLSACLTPEAKADGRDLDETDSDWWVDDDRGGEEFCIARSLRSVGSTRR